MHNLRAGTAFDAHQLQAGKECWIAGVLHPGYDGCEGHSDGDVVSHAIVDAVLSAAGLGDLGSFVGVGRPEYDGVRGVQLLQELKQLVDAHGHSIINASAQLIAQTPKMSKVREECERTLSEALGAPVSVSATTTDHMGFTGSGQGRAAIATALVELGTKVPTSGT
ncbi:2-C-methyl-D-erythritol 2,4-cyclodiphosphate synthase [Corynebacterium sp. Q4381]|uniref:2-C-methyl-D-erythritol 2,4-cyclodiphosphate synthase n=1 Tax=Corynebacterium sp. Marseille-Q4381 TaxID=3121597 RepID=UPI002FE5D611